jgi:hypothetical protein
MLLGGKDHQQENTEAGVNSCKNNPVNEGKYGEPQLIPFIMDSPGF